MYTAHHRVLFGMYLQLFSVLPRSSFLVIWSQVWECCSFYGLRSILVLMLTSVFGHSDASAFGIYVTVVSMSDILSIFGGYLGERDDRVAVTLGIITALAGTALICIQSAGIAMYSGLAMLTVGVAFYRPNAYSVIGSLVGRSGSSPSEIRAHIDSAFLLSLIFQEIGFMMLYLLVGMTSRYIGWVYALYAVFAIMAVSATFLFCFHVQSKGIRHVLPWLFRDVLTLKLISVTFLLCILSYLCLEHQDWSFIVVLIVFVQTIIYTIIKAMRVSAKERTNCFAFLVYMLLFIMFIAIERQIFTTLPLFFERNVTKIVCGFEVPVLALYIVMPLVGLVCGLIIANFLYKSTSDSILPGNRFIAAFALLSTSFALMLWGCANANIYGSVPLIFPLLAITGFPLANIILSSSIFSLANRLSPPGMRGLFNGIALSWLAFGTMLAKPISALMVIPDNHNINPVESLVIYLDGFYVLLYMCLFMVGASVIAKLGLDKICKDVAESSYDIIGQSRSRAFQDI